MSRLPKVTPWFPAEVRPVHAGIYEVEGVLAPFHYWDGKQWLHIAAIQPYDITKKDIRKAKPIAEWATYINSHQWRGLSEKPA